MSENTHPAVAKFRQEGVHEWQSDWGSTDATNLAAIIDAQVEATLALAYEQRTANLIALWSNPKAEIEDMRGHAMEYGINDDTVGKILQEITERLDLA